MKRHPPAADAAAKPALASYRQIVSELRGEILSGKFALGQRLPTKAALELRFHAAGVTVQRAIRELVTEGLLRTR